MTAPKRALSFIKDASWVNGREDSVHPKYLHQFGCELQIELGTQKTERFNKTKIIKPIMTLGILERLRNAINKTG